MPTAKGKDHRDCWFYQIDETFLFRTGSSDGISRECLVCHGTGIETETRRLGSMIHQTQGVCRQCHGEGRMIDREKRCKRCHGDKVIEKQRELDIDVPHGSTHGESIRFSGQGHQIVSIEQEIISTISSNYPLLLAQWRIGFHFHRIGAINTPNIHSSRQ